MTTDIPFLSGSELTLLGVVLFCCAGIIVCVFIKARILRKRKPPRTKMEVVGQERLQYLESLVHAWQQHATYFEVRDAIATVESITKEIFDASFERLEHEDCEISGDHLFEILVFCTGDVDSILRKQNEWHSRVAGMPLKTRRLFHLSIDPVD